MHFWSGLNVALGALSFLMLEDGALFWVGFACAAVSLVLGTVGKKSPVKSKRICSLAGIVLAVAAAAVYAGMMLGAGVRYVEML